MEYDSRRNGCARVTLLNLSLY